MERNKLAYPPRNNQRTSETLNPSQQNHLQSARPAIGGRNSQFRHQNTSERTHNFHHTPHDHQQPVVPPYGPWYLIRVPNQWFGSSMAVPNQSSSVGFHFLQAAQYSMEEQTFIMDAVENNLNSTYNQTASSSHGNNNVYGGSLDARRDMGRVQYPEIENYVNFYYGVLPYYTDGYQLHPHPPPSAMQAMRGNNFNSRPQWLANLEEPMGHANVGLSNEEVHMHLQIRTHTSPADQLNSEPDICVICQGEYKNDEKIGTLPCGHEYHVDCIKKWLQQKTVCPLCKAPARA
ncbi:hypothetical protein Acr_23g0012740 [Actinidia rufa]|uniref:RING-type E3 ubiquitin transferase n=1 Tax=Actinidia rufa TaxID=165716 RepID=A0A7J0GQ14_9ERIC|nr:hypothetical protein Acr_23g0012740 [Actinidia rufa]